MNYHNAIRNFTIALFAIIASVGWSQGVTTGVEVFRSSTTGENVFGKYIEVGAATDTTSTAQLNSYIKTDGRYLLNPERIYGTGGITTATADGGRGITISGSGITTGGLTTDDIAATEPLRITENDPTTSIAIELDQISASVYEVGTNRAYRTIQSALDAIHAVTPVNTTTNAVVMIFPGTYPEWVEVHTTGVTMRGMARDNCILSSNTLGTTTGSYTPIGGGPLSEVEVPTLWVLADDVKLENFTVENTYYGNPSAALKVNYDYLFPGRLTLTTFTATNMRFKGLASDVVNVCSICANSTFQNCISEGGTIDSVACETGTFRWIGGYIETTSTAAASNTPFWFYYPCNATVADSVVKFYGQYAFSMTTATVRASNVTFTGTGPTQSWTTIAEVPVASTTNITNSAMPSNTTSGTAASVGWGINNSASANYTFAGGQRSAASSEGSVVLTDATFVSLSSPAVNTFNTRFANGYYIGGGDFRTTSSMYERNNHVVSVADVVATAPITVTTNSGTLFIGTSSAAATTPSLQQVTDVGTSTTNAMSATGGLYSGGDVVAGDDFIGLDDLFLADDANVSDTLQVTGRSFLYNTSNSIGLLNPIVPFGILTIGGIEPNLNYGAMVNLVDTRAIATDVGPRVLMNAKYTSAGDVTGGGGFRLGKENATSGQYGYNFYIFTRPNGGNVTDRVKFGANGGTAVYNRLAVGTSTEPTSGNYLQVTGSGNFTDDLTVTDDTALSDTLGVTGRADFYSDVYGNRIHAVVVQSAEPSSPYDGMFWIDTDDSTFYIYYNGAWWPVASLS